MSQRTEVAAQSVSRGMILGGAAHCLLAISTALVPAPMTVLRRYYEDQRATGAPPRDVVARVEAKWRAMVDKQRRGRMIGGIINLGIGIPAFSTGLVFALSPVGLAHMSEQAQYGWAGALIGFDNAIYQGVVALVSTPTLDITFSMYRALKYQATTSSNTPFFLASRVRFTPLQHGGLVSAVGTF